MTEEKIKKFCELAITKDNAEIRTRDFLEAGFNANDLHQFYKSGYIVRERIGFYHINDESNLIFKYAIEKAKTDDFVLVKARLYRYLDIPSFSHEALYALILISLKEKNYAEALELNAMLLNSNNSFYVQDANFFKAILNRTIEEPNDHLALAKYLKPDEIFILGNDSRFQDVTLLNHIRIDAFEANFSYALKLFANLENSFKDSIIGKITFELINTAYQRRKNLKKMLVELVKSNEYNKIIYLLETESTRAYLPKYEEYVLKLARVMQSISIGEKPLRQIIGSIDNIFIAIDTGNYPIALNMCAEHNTQRQFINGNSALYLLLNQICLSLGYKQANNHEVLELNRTLASMIVQIAYNLSSKDLETCIPLIREYLSLASKEEYEFLILGLAEICMIEDATFMPVKNALSMLASNQNIDFSEYVSKFYNSLKNRKLHVASIYLEIARTAHLLNLDNQRITKEVLENMIDSYNLVIGANNYQSTSDKEVKDKQDIEAKFQLLNMTQKGAIFLDKITSRNYSLINRIARDYPAVELSFIGEYPNSYGIIRYKGFNFNYIDCSALSKLARDAYNIGNYQKDLEYLFEMLRSLKNPKAALYSKIGMAFLCLNEDEEALNYLSIAHEISKSKEDGTLDFGQMIDWLKEKVSSKSKAGDPLNDFTLSQELIFKENNLAKTSLDFLHEAEKFAIDNECSLIQACRNLGYSGESTLEILLLHIDELYANGDYDGANAIRNYIKTNKFVTTSIMERLSEIENRYKACAQKQKIGSWIKPLPYK